MTRADTNRYNKLMAEYNQSSIETVINPNFFLPPNVLDLRYLQTDEDGDPQSVVDVEVTYPIDEPVDDVPPTNDGSSPDLPIPDGITFVSQTVRSPTGGGYVIDVVIDIPDIPGVDGFEVSVAKV